MRLLFPSDPFKPSACDEAYAEEFAVACAQGISCSLFSFEDFEGGEFKPRPAFNEGEQLIYRGWMLTPDRYAQLHEAILAKGGRPITSPDQYRRCHYLPEWYPLCQEFTPETITVPRGADFVAALAGKKWPAYFVKDYVKSLSTQRGSVASTPEGVAEVVSLIEQYRGSIEGGVCIRAFESLEPASEERYFVFNGQAFGREVDVPQLVHEIAKRIPCPFYSVDVVAIKDGALRLIELGDGQVSDRKQWPAHRFFSVLCAALGGGLI